MGRHAPDHASQIPQREIARAPSNCRREPAAAAAAVRLRATWPPAAAGGTAAPPTRPYYLHQQALQRRQLPAHHPPGSWQLLSHWEACPATARRHHSASQALNPKIYCTRHRWAHLHAPELHVTSCAISAKPSMRPICCGPARRLSAVRRAVVRAVCSTGSSALSARGTRHLYARAHPSHVSIPGCCYPLLNAEHV